MKLDFEKQGGLIPAIIQDAKTDKVLMLGYMNEESLAKTQQEGRVCFFSRSKQRLWTKGETSGNFLEVVSIKEDCDQDALLIKVNPVGPVCHTGSDTCFEEENQTPSLNFLHKLSATIKDRKENPSDSSYTSKLFARGINKVAQKVGEEAVELVIEAKDDDKSLFLNEAADLLYHTLVLLEAKNSSLYEVLEVLEERHS
ncbi:MAG: bifunctional phosphoribosyl-AMP cyclohydrolase/phosphoribosyl-ATP diphosphatase HisIE [Bacteroidia bacterium]|nr:bifunctional phosphoribosyl-AMP cyclohydrolase/phosphoribosyl-ATP diphosphatase HisIE [Bacteroidia bacterium]